MPTNDFSPIADTEVHYLRSDHVGDEFKIFIGHCPGLTPSPPIVLYVSDANGYFAGAVEIVRLMQTAAHLPSMLVVGVGYGMGWLEETSVIRARDLTPSYDAAFARIFPNQTMMGGADRFLAFIREELQPWVHSRYDVTTDDSAFFGHSLGGLFANYVLLTAPDTFHKYAIGSPSLWWHNDMLFETEAHYAEHHTDLAARAFFSVGQHEDQPGREHGLSRLPPEEQAATKLRHMDMVADTERMVTAIRSRNYPSLAIDSVVLPDEFHVTVAHLNLSRALRYLFDAPR